MRCKRCGRSTFGTPKKDARGMYYVCGVCKARIDFTPQRTEVNRGISRCPRCGTAISIGWRGPVLTPQSNFHAHLTCPVCQLALYD